MRILYTLIVEFARYFLPLVAGFNQKIKRFQNQRETTFKDISEWKRNQSSKPVMWLHCASLGEYEMIVPLISDSEVQSKFEVVVSFFSASGYDHAKTEGIVRGKFYLPLDRIGAMKQLVSQVNPSVFVLVKYDFWLNLMRALNKSDCTNVVVNGQFRTGQFITSALGSPWRNQLKKFHRIYVQYESSMKVLESLSFENTTLSNDLRYDRAMQLKTKNHEIPSIAAFTKNQPTLILGSSWPEEEYIALQYLTDFNTDIKAIIAPHDVSQTNIKRIQNAYQHLRPKLFTDSDDFTESRVVILNTIGHLSSAYQYATVAFVGGAFGKGLHNVLEAAVHGLPIFSGNNIDKFPEAKTLQKLGVLHPVDQDPRHFLELIGVYDQQGTSNKVVEEILRKWFEEQTGHSEEIARYVCGLNLN
jgi:3-deoxy-D-manno-octulosonic-acid transferase